MAPRKRTHDEVDLHDRSPSHENHAKQQKTDRLAQAAAESNSESSYVSAAAAIFSDSEEDDSDTAPSSPDASDSELSTSSEEPSSESEGEEESDDDNESNVHEMDEMITNVRPGSKPSITRRGVDGGGLLKRLKTFLPEMQDANEELEREREAGTLDRRNIERCEEDGPHIEMNLGLGVLEEKEEDMDDEDDMSDGDSDDGHEDVMQRLMGQARQPASGMKIQEVGGG